MAKTKISAVVNTRNEAENIYDCLRSLKFADEIVVVDMESTDQTKEIAKDFTDRIFDTPNINFVEPARNFAIKQAIGDWILIVDADERISKTLAAKLLDIAEAGEVDFVRLPRKNLIFGQWIQHSRFWPDYNIRFFKKGSVEWQDEIHSIPITYGTGISLDATEELAIEHLHYRTVDEFIERALRYSRQQAKELKSNGYQFDPSDIITKPVSEFLSRFFAGDGYKDGLHGLILALLQSFAILLIYLRLWQDTDNQPVKSAQMLKIWPKVFGDKAKEMKYWLFTVKFQHEPNKYKKIFYKFLRRLSR